MAETSRSEGIFIPVTEKPGVLQWAAITEQLQYLWQKRKWLLKIALIGAVTGLAIVSDMPKEYTTTVKLAPETEEMTRKMSDLGGLAAMAGIHLNNTAASDAIPPELYPEVVHSTPFLLSLLPIQFIATDNGAAYPLYDYLTNRQRQVWWKEIFDFPAKAAERLTELFRKEKTSPDAEINPFRLTRKQIKTIRNLRKRITASVDKKTQVITVSVKMQDALISARLTQTVLENLQKYIHDYRTEKVKTNLEFTRKVFTEARENYYKAQRDYASFQDTNRNIHSSSYRTEQERLQNEMTLTFSIYNTLAQKLEQDKLRVQEQLPVYTVIEPASIPVQPSTPRKIVILGGIVLLSVLLGAAYQLLKNDLIRFRLR